MVTITCKQCLEVIDFENEEDTFRYQCCECDKFNLCKKCYELESLYYNIPPLNYNYSVDGLSADYQPVEHTCKSISLPHYYTKEKELQKNIFLKYIKKENAYETMKNAFSYFSDRLCLGVREKCEKSEFPSGYSRYKWFTFDEIHQVSNYLANSLSFYLKPKEGMAIYANNCIEWYLMDFASLWNRYVMVPIHSTSNSQSLMEIFKNSRVSGILCSNKNLMNLVQIFKENPNQEWYLKLIIQIEDQVDQDLIDFIPKEIEFKRYSEILEFGKNNSPQFPQEKREPDDIAQINYTSGSTGIPKGVLFNDTVFNKQITPFCTHHYPFASHNLVPLSHADRIITWGFLSAGGRVGIYSGVNETIFEDASLIQPHIFYNVPRLFNLLFSQFKDAIESIRKSAPQLSIEEAESKIIPKFSKIYGERVKIIGTASAPIGQDVLDFIRKCFGSITFLYAYGQTEAFFVTFNGEFLKGVEYRIDPAPELDYYPTDKPYPRGELHIKSPFMSQGYNNLTEDDKTFDNGWVKTGDIVELVGERKINIIGRRKVAFKLSNGKFVSPHLLENAFQTCKLLDQIFIYGDTMKSVLVAIVIPNAAILKKYKESGTDIKACYQYKKQLIDAFKVISKKRMLARYEVPQEIHIDDVTWSFSNGLVLSSGKVSRNALYQHYKASIDSMYKRIDELEENLRDPKSFNDFIRNLLNIPMDAEIDFNELSFSDIGGDSLTAVRLSSLLNQNYSLDISPTLILNKNIKISNIIEMLNKDSKEGLTIKEPNWLDEMKLPDDIIDLAKRFNSKKIETKTKDNIIFLTGCTGFLGSFLLTELVKTKNTFCSKVYCLLRNANNEQQGKEYLLDVLRKTKLNLSTIDPDRIVAVIGDLNKSKFGLSDEDFSKLSERVDIIIHNAAVVNMALPYHNLKQANVESVKDCIRLSLMGQRIKKFAYVSTMGIFMENGDFNSAFTIQENTPVSLKTLHSNQGYTSTKLVADQLVQKVSEQLGIETLIFRPGTIYAHSKTGYDNENDFVSLIIKAILNSKTYPLISEDKKSTFETNYFNLSPVDWVANSIITLIANQADASPPSPSTPPTIKNNIKNAFNFWSNVDKAYKPTTTSPFPSSPNQKLSSVFKKISKEHLESDQVLESNCKIYNIVNNHSIPIEQICSAINQIYPIKGIAYDEWRVEQFQSHSSILYPMKGIFFKNKVINEEGREDFKFPAFTKSQFKSTTTKTQLESLKRAECQPISQEQFTKNIRYLLSLNDLNKQST